MSADSSFRRDDERDTGTKDRMVGRMRSLVSDAERTFQNAAEASSDRLSGVKENLGRTVERTREQLDTARRVIGDRSRAGTEAARGYVRAKPLASVGVATAAGLLVGLLVVAFLTNRQR